MPVYSEENPVPLSFLEEAASGVSYVERSAADAVIEGGFESGGAAWTLNPYATIDSAVARSGGSSLRLKGLYSFFGPILQLGTAIQTTNAEAGEELVLRCYVRWEGFGADDSRLTIYRGDGLGGILVWETVNQTDVAEGEWLLVETAAVVLADPLLRFNAQWLAPYTDGSGHWWIDDVSMPDSFAWTERSTPGTGWSEE